MNILIYLYYTPLPLIYKSSCTVVKKVVNKPSIHYNVCLVCDYLVLSQIMVHYTLQIQAQVPEISKGFFIKLCYVWKFASFSANFVQNSENPQISYINVVAKQNLFLLLTSDFLGGHYGQ